MKLGNIFKNASTIAAAKKLLENADLTNANLSIGGAPTGDAVASAKVNINAVIRVGDVNLNLDLRDVIVEVK